MKYLKPHKIFDSYNRFGLIKESVMKIKRYSEFIIETIDPKTNSWLDLPKSQKGQFLEAPKVDPNDIKNIKINFKLIESSDGEELYQVIFTDEIVKKYPFLGDYTKEEHDKRYLTISKVKYHNNRLHFVPGIPPESKGTGLGLTIYKQFIKFLGYGSSNVVAKIAAKKLWSKIIKDEDFISLLTDQSVLVFDKNYKGDFDKVVKNFVSTKFVSKEFLQVDPELEKRLGEWFKFWRNTNPESLINFDKDHLEKLIDKNEDLTPKSGDVAYDEQSKKIYYIYFDFPDKKEGNIYHCGSLSDDKSGEPENIPLNKVSKFKVIKRLPFTSKNTGYTMVPKRTID
jgi:hypothetical protein